MTCSFRIRRETYASLVIWALPSFENASRAIDGSRDVNPVNKRPIRKREVLSTESYKQ